MVEIFFLIKKINYRILNCKYFFLNNIGSSIYMRGENYKKKKGGINGRGVRKYIIYW